MKTHKWYHLSHTYMMRHIYIYIYIFKKSPEEYLHGNVATFSFFSSVSKPIGSMGLAYLPTIYHTWILWETKNTKSGKLRGTITSSSSLSKLVRAMNWKVSDWGKILEKVNGECWKTPTKTPMVCWTTFLRPRSVKQRYFVKWKIQKITNWNMGAFVP